MQGSLDHSVVCLSEQICAWKPAGSEGLAGFET